MSKQTITIVLRAVISLTILLGGVGITVLLISSRKDAPQVKIPESALRVDVIEATFKDVPVTIEGLGEIQSRDVVEIAPEVSGRVVNIHPELEVGGVIPAGEILFEVDPRDYQARLDQSVAQANQLRSTIERLKKEYTIDKKRLITFERSRELAKAEYERMRNLYERDKIATRSQAENAEVAYNNANDAYAQLEQSLDLFPIRIKEAEDNLVSAESMSKMSTTNLERTRVSVPFDARVKNVSVEQGQYVSPGMPVLTLANDSVLEVSVSLDSQLASKWLKYDSQKDTEAIAWFGTLAQVPVKVSWTSVGVWEGMLHRIEKFDKETRTINVVVRIPAENAMNPIEGTQPLVEGMFCKISIPGAVAKNVVEVPIESVSFAQDSNGFRDVYIAKESPDDGKLRLETIKVRESHIAGEYIYLSEGLTDGDVIITTRLINPLAKSLLNVNSTNSLETD